MPSSRFRNTTNCKRAKILQRARLCTSTAYTHTPLLTCHLESRGRNKSPSGRKSDPSGRRSIPSGRNLNPSGRKLSPSGRKTRPSGRKVSPSGRNLSPSGRNFFWEATKPQRERKWRNKSAERTTCLAKTRSGSDIFGAKTNETAATALF
eukprot:1991332-Amphidinium_carterae.1